MPQSNSWPFIIALTLILTSECYLIIGISTLKADVRSAMRRVYLLACVCLAVWSSMYGMMVYAGREDHMRLFWTVGFFACGLFFPAWLHFLLHLVNYNGKHQRRWLVFFYTSSIAVTAACIASGDVQFVHTPLGNQFTYGGSFIFKGAILYYILLLSVTLLLQLLWWRTSRLKRQKKQALVFAVVTLIIAPPGLLFDFLFPAFLDTPIVPITTTLVLFVSLYLYFTMRANRGLNVTVENAADIIFKSVTIPVLLLDYEDRVVLPNSAAWDFFGVWHGSLVGKTLEELVLVDEKAPAPALFDQSFASLVVTTSAQSGLRTCDMLLTVTRDRYGDVLNKVAVLRDITEMQAALDRAQEASRAKSDFLSRMSHEIRTPMNAIIGMTKIGLRTEDPQRMHYCLEKVNDASIHLLGLINDVLDMSKIEANKLELTADRFDLEKMLESVCSVVAVRAEEKHIDFLVDMDPDVPRDVTGDELRLSQIVTNLLSNAVKFTPERGTVRLNVVYCGEAPGGASRVQIEVADTGIGMTEEQAARLFSAFEQAEGNIARRFGGTGLGLAISQRIANLMGGEITVQSALGKGSTFSLALELVRAAPDAARAARDTALFSHLRVLVVDDSPEILQYFERFFSRLNASFDLAESGEVAVEYARAAAAANLTYDIIFVDYLMEGLDGIETTRRIRAILGDGVPVIMVSVAEWQAIQQNAAEAGITRFLQKPLFSSAVFNAIHALVAGHAGPNPAPARPAFPAENLRAHTILLAEDIEINREIVAGLLEDTALCIEFARDGAEAVQMFEQAPDRYGLILMDIQMPVMDGLTATRRIRALGTPRAKSVPIIAMTADAFKEDVQACLAAGMNDHIGKPVDPDELLAKLGKYLPNRAR